MLTSGADANVRTAPRSAMGATTGPRIVLLAVCAENSGTGHIDGLATSALFAVINFF